MQTLVETFETFLASLIDKQLDERMTCEVSKQALMGELKKMVDEVFEERLDAALEDKVDIKVNHLVNRYMENMDWSSYVDSTIGERDIVRALEKIVEKGEISAVLEEKINTAIDRLEFQVEVIKP